MKYKLQIKYSPDLQLFLWRQTKEVPISWHDFQKCLRLGLQLETHTDTNTVCTGRCIQEQFLAINRQIKHDEWNWDLFIMCCTVWNTMIHLYFSSTTLRLQSCAHLLRTKSYWTQWDFQVNIVVSKWLRINFQHHHQCVTKRLERNINFSLFVSLFNT